MPILTARPPKYCRYRQGARVTIQGRTHYLPGAYNSKESLAKYRELVAQWGAGIPADPPAGDQDTLTVAELFAQYLDYAKVYYGDIPRGRYRNLAATIKAAGLFYADLPAAEFSPKKLKVLRQSFVDAGHTPGHCNTCVQRVIGVFRWGAEEELIQGTLVHALEAARPLQRGHCARQLSRFEGLRSDLSAALPAFTKVDPTRHACVLDS